MAATGTRQQQPTATPAAAVVDPKFEWAEKDGSYVLRLTLTGFRKDDFRVQVDSAGRLTVRGATRPGGGGPGASLHKVFQLPATASLDDIAGRFEAGVLTLTVPKLASSGTGAAKDKEDGAPPTSIEEIKRSNKPGVAKEEGAKPAPTGKVDGGAAKPPPRELEGAKKVPAKDNVAGKKEASAGVEPKERAFSKTTRQVAEQVQRMEEEANRRKQEQQKPAPAAKEEEVKPKAPQPAPAAATPEKPAPKKEEEVKPKAPQPSAAAGTPEKPAPKPNVAISEKAKAAVDRESLAEKVRQRGEEERAKAANAETATEAKAGQEKKAVASTCMAWKERIAGELKGLADMKWADNAVEMARKNKEVVAVGVAAFSLGFLAANKLFRK